jgi:hypothetical protein
MTQLENFIKAFDSNSSSIHTTCECGFEFYIGNPNEAWEEGEFEKLQSDRHARALDFMVPSIFLDGRYYVTECKCWHTKAGKIISWLDSNDLQIAEWFKLEKARKTQEATDAVEIELHQP